MMTSSGSGSYRVGGSLSSSNLSPLAPPFKVDKSLMKSNSNNPSEIFSDVHVPLYGACFDPAPGQIWNSSSSLTSLPKCVASESVVTNTNCSSSANVYGYRDSQSSTLPASAYYGSSNGVSGYDPFTYEPFPKSVSSNTDEAKKSYYPSYVPPPPQKDGYLSLGIGGGPNYDLLSYSGSHLSGFGSAHVDHTQAVSGDVGYKSKWGYSWSGLNESEHENWTDYANGFVSKDLNISNSSSNKSPLFVDGGNKNQPFVDVSAHPFVDGSNRNHLFGDVGNKSNLNQGACVSQDQGLHGEASSVKDNCFDIFGGAYTLGNLGIDEQDYKSSSKCSRTQNSAFVDVSRESPHLQEPVLESVTGFCGSQRGNGSSSDDQFSRASFYTFGCASTASTFPTTTIKLPYSGSSSSVENTPLVVKENPVSMDATNQCNTAAGYDFSYQVEPRLPHNLMCQSSIRIRRPSSSSRIAPSCKLGEADYRLDDKGGYEQILISPQLSHQLSLDGLNMEASDVEAAYTVEKHSVGSEGHNPAEDSPCWRGASSSHYSPFEHSESVASDGLLKKFDGCRTFNPEDIQNKSLLSHTFESKDISGKLNKVTSVEKPSVSACTEDSEYCDAVNQKYCCFDLNAGDSLQFTVDCHASTVDDSMTNKLKADSNSNRSSAEQLIPEKEISSASKTSETRGNDSSVVAENGSPLNIDSNSNSLPVNESSCKSAGENSDTRIDVNVLLRTMMNLSEIFRCYCFSNRAELEKKHSIDIKQIINNLNASMSMGIGQTVPTTVFPSPDTFIQKEFPVVQMVNDAEALAASMKLGRTAEDFSDNVSSEDDRNPFGDVNMTEAVKKLLSENLQEEMDQQKLVYKNLWLEAEASLCVMTAKARFNRMKNEMERALDGAKDKDNPTSSNVSANMHNAVDSTTEAKKCQSMGECPRPPTLSQHDDIEQFNISNAQVAHSNFAENERSGSKDTSFPSLYVSRPGGSVDDSDDPLTTSHANDVEACVMARYEILQSRVGCPDSLNYESQPSSGGHKCPLSPYESVNGFHASGSTTEANDLETSVFGGYRILKCQDDNSDYLNSKGQQLPGEENYLPDIDSTSLDKTLQDSQMSNSLGVTDSREASVMARFRILQSRIDQSNSMTDDSAPGRQESTVVVEDETGEMGGIKQKPNIKITTFGPYPELAEDEDVSFLNIGVNEQTFAPILKSNKMNSVIFEGWYDNDGSSSDWEHISQVAV